MAAEEPQTTGPTPFIFVLMPFKQDFADIYKFGIKGAAEDVGAYAERVDEQMFAEGILERIFNQINKADIIVADMTGQNSNVFYEVGYAHALNKIVLLLTQDANDIPFDLKHRTHLVYENSINKLRTALIPRLKWAIEEARRRGRQETSRYRLVISLLGVELPELSTGAPPPSFSAVATHLSREASLDESAAGSLGFDIRNEGPDVSDTISHIYLFTEEHVIVILKRSHIAPKELARVAGNELGQMRASDIDKALLSLPVQYRIPQILPQIPPGAIERLACFYHDLDTDTDRTSARFCLRLHTKNGPLNFPFSLDFAF